MSYVRQPHNSHNFIMYLIGVVGYLHVYVLIARSSSICVWCKHTPVFRDSETIAIYTHNEELQGHMCINCSQIVKATMKMWLFPKLNNLSFSFALLLG